MSLNWTTVENALAVWARTGSGLASGQVGWWGQGVARPAGQYISISLISIRNPGRDWVTIRNAEDPEDGAEIEHVVAGNRIALIRMQCIGGATIGAASCASLLNKVITSQALPTVMAALQAAGIGIGIVSPVTALGGDINQKFEPRATVDINLFLAEELVGTGTYIETVEVTNDTTAEEFTVALP